MIEVSSLSYAYGKTEVLKNVGWKVNNGKIYGVFGDKKSGKSTLLALLSGGLPLQSGTVRINGFDLSKNAASAKRCIGYLPQDARYYPGMTPYELLDFVASAKRVRDDRRFLHVHETLETTGLGTKRDCPISRLTPTQLRWLGLAQAMIGDPEILILDDPAAGLSPSDGKELRAAVKELGEHGKTIFFASSEATGMPTLCDEIFLLRDGCLTPPSPVSEIISGTSLRTRVKGEKARLQETIGSIEGLLSCRFLPTEGDGSLCLLIRADRQGMLPSVAGALTSAGMEVTECAEEAPDSAELALRRAAAAAGIGI